MTFFSGVVGGDGEKSLRDAMQLMLGSAVPVHFKLIVGLDTERIDGKVALIQLSTSSICILIHRDSQLFDSPALCALLNNTFPEYENRRIFSGAAITGDVQGIQDINRSGEPFKVCGVLDLTPIYSRWYPIGAPPSPALAVSMELKVDQQMGLKAMFEKVLGPSWKKRIHHGWSEPLNLGHLKYAALDAWVSCKLGIHAYENLHTYGVDKLVIRPTQP